MEILIHGTKGGCKTLYPVQDVPEVMYRFASDARRTDSKGNTHWNLYSIAFSGQGCIFSKYIGVRDVLRQYGGFIAFSVHLPQSQMMDGQDLKQLLDELAGRYCNEYVQDGNLGDVHEEWLFVNAVANLYGNRMRSTSFRDTASFQSGTGEPAFVYYEDDAHLCKYLDAPLQDEYKPYRQVFFIDRLYKESEENPLNALRHDPQADLTSVIDLENTKYRLRLPQRTSSSSDANVEIRVNGSLKRSDDRIYRKDIISVTYQKRFHDPIHWEGRISDSEASQFLTVSEGTVTVLPPSFDTMRPSSKLIEVRVEEKNGKPVGEYNLTASSYSHPEKRLGQTSSVVFTGEELGDQWRISVETPDGKKDSRSIIPDNQENPVLLQPQKTMRVTFTVIDEDNGDLLRDYKITISINGVRTEVMNDEYDFKGEEIEDDFVVNVSKDGYESRLYKFCPSRDPKPTIRIKKGMGSQRRYYLEVDDNKGYVDTHVIYKPGDQQNHKVEAQKGYRFVEWEDHANERKNVGKEKYDGYFKAVFKEILWYKFRWVLLGAAVVAVSVLIILLFHWVMSAGNTTNAYQKYHKDLKEKIAGCKNDSTSLDNLLTVWRGYKTLAKEDGELELWEKDTTAISDALGSISHQPNGNTSDKKPDDQNELKRKEIEDAFWTLYAKTCHGTQDEWNNFYNTYKCYGKSNNGPGNPYVNFITETVAKGTKPYNKFINLSISISKNEHNVEQGLKKIQDAYNGKTSEKTEIQPAQTPSHKNNNDKETKAWEAFKKLVQNPTATKNEYNDFMNAQEHNDTECYKFYNAIKTNSTLANHFPNFTKQKKDDLANVNELNDVKELWNKYKKEQEIE